MDKTPLLAIEPKRHRGGELRLLAVTDHGLFGVLTLPPGEVFREHYHPYSSESLFVFEGDVLTELDGAPVPMGRGDNVLVPVGVRHRISNVSDRTAHLVFAVHGKAPRPELGHVDTEDEYRARAAEAEATSR